MRFEKIELDSIKMRSFDLDYGENGESFSYAYDDPIGGLGCLFSVLYYFIPPKIKKRKFIIEKFGETNEVLNRISIILDKREFDYLSSFINQTKS